METDADAYQRMQRQAERAPGATLRMVITLYPDGAMSIEAPIADKKFCLHLLDEAREAIKRQPEPGQIIVPGEDVDSRPKAAYA